MLEISFVSDNINDGLHIEDVLGEGSEIYLDWNDVNYLITQLISYRDMKDSQIKYDKINGIEY